MKKAITVFVTTCDHCGDTDLKTATFTNNPEGVTGGRFGNTYHLCDKCVAEGYKFDRDNLNKIVKS